MTLTPSQVRHACEKKKRVRRVEYDPGWGWITRTKDGRELGCGIEDGWRWSSRSVARAVIWEWDAMEAMR